MRLPERCLCRREWEDTLGGAQEGRGERPDGLVSCHLDRPTPRVLEECAVRLGKGCHQESAM